MSYYNKFQRLKRDSLRVSKLINELSQVETDPEKARILEEKSYSVAECGTHAVFGVTRNNNKKLIYNNFCRQRFCPHCAAIISSERSSSLGRCVDKLFSGSDPGQFIFLTLTVRSVPGSELRDSVKEILKQFSSYIKDYRLNSGIRGYVRNLEVTYNSREDTYHPHIHVLVHVDTDYFINKEKYICQAKWLEVWRRYMHDDSIEFVNVKKVKDPLKAVPEVTKYMTKFNWIYNKNAKFVLAVFMDALKGCNLYRLSGDLKQLVKEVREENKEERKQFKEVLVNQIIQNANCTESGDQEREVDFVHFLSFQWRWQVYVFSIFMYKHPPGYYSVSLKWDFLSVIKSSAFLSKQFQDILYKVNCAELGKIYDKASVRPDPSEFVGEDFVNSYVNDI